MPEFEHTDLKKKEHQNDVFVPGDKEKDTVQAAVDMPEQKDPVPGKSIPPRAEEKVARSVKEAEVDQKQHLHSGPGAADPLKSRAKIRGRWKLASHIQAEQAAKSKSNVFGEVHDPEKVTERLSGDRLRGEDTPQKPEPQQAKAERVSAPEEKPQPAPEKVVAEPATVYAAEPRRRQPEKEEKAVSTDSNTSAEESSSGEERGTRTQRSKRQQSRGGRSGQPRDRGGEAQGRQRRPRRDGGRPAADGQSSRTSRTHSERSPRREAPVEQDSGVIARIGRFFKGLFNGSDAEAPQEGVKRHSSNRTASGSRVRDAKGEGRSAGPQRRRRRRRSNSSSSGRSGSSRESRSAAEAAGSEGRRRSRSRRRRSSGDRSNSNES